MAQDIEAAVAACIKVRNAAAAPLVFSSDATSEANDRTKAQFEKNLPKIQGGFQTVEPAVLKAAGLFGALAKTIALFHDSNAKEISKDDAMTARLAMERACRFKIAKAAGKNPDEVDASEGLVCA
jgi:hypothetical protein